MGVYGAPVHGGFVCGHTSFVEAQSSNSMRILQMVRYFTADIRPAAESKRVREPSTDVDEKLKEADARARETVQNNLTVEGCPVKNAWNQVS